MLKTEIEFCPLQSYQFAHCSPCTNTGLFDVAEQRDATHDPVVGLDGGLEHQRRDVGQVGATRFLVDGTLVDERLPGTTLFQVDGENVNHRQRRVQHLGRLLHQATVAPIPAGAVQKQSVNVHACVHSHAKPHHHQTVTR